MSFTPTAHAVLGLPTPAQAFGMGARAWEECLARREEIIRKERLDPFGNLWEPPIWRVCDALMGFPWVEAQWAERMRRCLGFAKPVRILLINGGQRSGKTQYAGSRLLRLLWLKAGARGWALHSTLQMSRDYHQRLMWEWLPRGLKGSDIKSKTTYVAYKQKTGFTEEKFILPNESDLLFKAYEQDITGIEGGELDVIWNDELVPSDWVETEELRITTRSGWMLITFTPVQGYSETVKLFQDGATTTRESINFLNPLDGGPPDVGRALGFGHDAQGTVEDQTAFGIYSPEEALAELWAAANHKGEDGRVKPRASVYPQSIPEQCDEWLEGKSGQPAVPAGREFARVPRVMRCKDAEGKRAVVFFHSNDNPYGNPKEVAATVVGKTQGFIDERYCGVAHKKMSARFPLFGRGHIVRPEEVPAGGTNYQFVDPTSGRNFFMLWIRVTPEGSYVYREWPGPYYIEGRGVPGPWALPDGKKADGKPGPGQETFGWGNRRYKEEIARLEGWRDWERAQSQAGAEGTKGKTGEAMPVDEWEEGNGAREVVAGRRMDSRFASAPKQENDRPTTLLTDFEGIGLYFTPAPGGPIHEGVQKINDLLHYAPGAGVDFWNKPRLWVSSECENLIFALQTWTGRDGEKGATKDPIDCLRYFATDDCPYLGEGGTGEGEEEEEGEAEGGERDWEETPKRYY